MNLKLAEKVGGNGGGFFGDFWEYGASDEMKINHGSIIDDDRSINRD